MTPIFQAPLKLIASSGNLSASIINDIFVITGPTLSMSQSVRIENNNKVVNIYFKNISDHTIENINLKLYSTVSFLMRDVRFSLDSNYVFNDLGLDLHIKHLEKDAVYHLAYIVDDPYALYNRIINSVEIINFEIKSLSSNLSSVKIFDEESRLQFKSNVDFVQTDKNALPLKMTSQVSSTMQANEFEYIIFLSVKQFDAPNQSINNITLVNELATGFSLNGSISMSNVAGLSLECLINVDNHSIIISNIDVPIGDLIKIKIPIKFVGQYF
ncbi:MAG: hypothetical protein ATN31_01670 [Candidatus Epulonipiscioides saccharophilum]|nr:MAG: hypothetical protein ATN31_01670 [Epulopiscium sp. AS2M-Bin001]